MIIKEIKSQYRRDFRAIYECEFCKTTKEDFGYDDSYFHEEVVPEMKCAKCGKSTKSENAPSSPRTPKYHDSVII